MPGCYADRQTDREKDREKECPLIDGTSSCSNRDSPRILKHRPASPILESEHAGNIHGSVKWDSLVPTEAWKLTQLQGPRTVPGIPVLYGTRFS